LAVVSSGMAEEIVAKAGAREPARPAGTLNDRLSASTCRDLSENPAEPAHSLHASGEDGHRKDGWSPAFRRLFCAVSGLKP
jgi:hypothetical protein